jgi:putative endonuclease
VLSDLYYTYVLRSTKDGKRYIGATSNLEQRLQAHNSGNVPSTRHRRPLNLEYYEACISQEDGFQRERYLKTKNGYMFLGNRLKAYLQAPQ